MLLQMLKWCRCISWERVDAVANVELVSTVYNVSVLAAATDDCCDWRPENPLSQFSRFG